MPLFRTTARLALGVLLAAPALVHAQATTAGPARAAAPKTMLGPPLKYTGKPDHAGDHAADLMTRLYIYADDSLMGRQVGTEYNLKAHRLHRARGSTPRPRARRRERRLLPEHPAVHSTTRTSAATTLKVGGEPLAYGTDYLPDPRAGRTHHLRRPAGDLRRRRRRLDQLAHGRRGRRQGRRAHRARRPPARSAASSTRQARASAKAAAILVASLDRFPAAVLPQIGRSTALARTTTPSAGADARSSSRRASHAALRRRSTA